MSIIGTWDVTVDGVMGKGHAVFTFTEDGGRIRCHIANDPSEPIVHEVHTNGNDVTLDIAVSRPAPNVSIGQLTLIDGDHFIGQAKRKFLPATSLSGIRVG